MADPQNNVQQLVNDPKFRDLAPAAKKRVLTGIDPAFGKLDDAGVVRVVNGLRSEPKETDTAIGQRYGEAVGVPTTAEGVKAAAHPFGQVSKALTGDEPTEKSNRVTEGVLLATGAAPVVTAGQAVVNYSKLLYDQTKNYIDTARKSLDDAGSGKKTGNEAAHDVTQAAQDLILKGLTSMVGGNAVANGITDLKGKNWEGLVEDLAGFATVMYLMKPGKNMSIADLPPKDLVRMDEHIASLVADVSDTTDRVTLAQEGRPLLRQAIQERGWTDQHMDSGVIGNKGKYPSRTGPGPLATKPIAQLDAAGKPTGNYVSNIREGARNVLRVTDDMVKIANRPFEDVLRNHGSTPATPAVKMPISKALRAEAAEYAKVHDTGLVNALNGLADTVDKTTTLGELDAIKVHANKEMEALAASTPGQAINASAQTAYAYKLAAEAIRTSLYPALEEVSGVNLQKFGMREHAAIGLRDGIYTTYLTRVDPLQASEASRGYLAGIMYGSKYTRHMVERMMRLNPMEAGDFASTFRKGVGPIGEGTTGEVIQTFGKPQKMLAGSTKPTQFTIPGGVPQEIVTGGSGADPQMNYVGQQEVPNPTHTPMQGSARYPQRQQLGTTEGTIPESIFNRNKPRMREQDAIGTAGTSTPERSFTGEPTKTESRWQYTTGAKGPTQEVRIAGPGEFRTSNPEAAYETLKQLRKITEGQEFMKYSFKDRELMRDAVASLDKQLRDYAAYKGRQAPRKTTITPARPGFIRPSVRGQAAAIAGQVNNQNQQDQPADASQ